MMATGLVVLLLVVALVPVTYLLSSGQETEDANDAAHVIKPMLTLLSQSPVYQANTAVEPLMELEDAWAIEDTREESGAPLVIGMRNGEQELGYDEESQTFYCTLGMEETEDWPEIALFAQGAEGMDNLRVAWIDDYTYDYRSDAIREGYRYELLAYTDTQYAYFGVVFTGLPIVTLNVQEGTQIGDQYVPACISVAGEGGEAVTEAAQIHTRGNEKQIPKHGYRIEFHTLSRTGRDKKKEVGLLGIEPDTDWLLLCNAQDETAVRNYLCFDLWNRWNADQDALMKVDSRLVEVFVQNEYMGLYQLMERVDPVEQIAQAGGDPDRDSLIRLGGNREGIWQRSWIDEAGFIAEYEYEANENAQRAFELFEDYVKLNSVNPPLDDEAFAQLAVRRMDMESVLSYYLFMQACGLVMDNAQNNLYIWTAWDEEEYHYRVAPWDMDFGIMRAEYQADGSLVRYFSMEPPAMRRILDLNLSGSREMLWRLWEEKRETVLSDEALETWIQDVEEEIYRSGAYLRESEKWRYGARHLDLSQFLHFVKEQMKVIDAVLTQTWPLQEK